MNRNQHDQKSDVDYDTNKAIESHKFARVDTAELDQKIKFVRQCKDHGDAGKVLAPLILFIEIEYHYSSSLRARVKTDHQTRQSEANLQVHQLGSKAIDDCHRGESFESKKCVDDQVWQAATESEERRA